MAKAQLAAVTGATGFLGRFVVAALLRSGWTVRILVRSEPMHPQLPQLSAEIVLGDLSDRVALRRLCVGTDAIIHIAGAIKARNRAGFFAANADGSELLAQAAAEVAPAAKVVNVSSMAAREPGLSDYAASKRTGEDALLNTASGPVTILRPSAIYGPWDRETLPLFKMAARGWIIAPRAPDARICLINAEDVADAVVAVTQYAEDTAIYELSDSHRDGYAWNDIADAAAQSVGKSSKVVNIPPAVFKIAGLVSETTAHLARRTPMLTAGKVREVLHDDWSSSAQKQPPKNWWQPKISLADGFADTAKWYAERNLL